MLLIKCCDISNEVRPMEVSEPWVDCLLEEYFNQVNFLSYFHIKCKDIGDCGVYCIFDYWTPFYYLFAKNDITNLI